MRYFFKIEFEKLKEIFYNVDEEIKERIVRVFFYFFYECVYFNIDGMKFEVIFSIVK